MKNNIIFLFQYVAYDRQENHDLYDISKVDMFFAMLDIDNDLKLKVYNRIAAIIQLGNIEFEESSTISCQVSTSTRIYLIYAAQLLNVDEKCLEASMLFRTLDVKGTELK